MPAAMLAQIDLAVAELASPQDAPPLAEPTPPALPASLHDRPSFGNKEVCGGGSGLAQGASHRLLDCIQ